MKLAIEPCDAPLGAIVTGISKIGPMDPADVATIRDALDEHIVLIFRGMDETPPDGELVKFAASFGGLRKRAPDASVLPHAPEINLVANTIVGKGGEGNPSASSGVINWHSDMAFELPVTQYIILEALETPPPQAGGQTIYTNLYKAYDDLSKDVRGQIDRLEMEYAMRPGRGEANYYSQFLADEELPHITHTLVQVNERTKRKSVWPNGGFMDTHIVGYSDDDHEEMYSYLREHVVKDEYLYAHDWQAGDLVFWDNMTTMHYRRAFDPETRRVMRHLSIKR